YAHAQPDGLGFTNPFAFSNGKSLAESQPLANVFSDIVSIQNANRFAERFGFAFTHAQSIAHSESLADGFGFADGFLFGLADFESFSDTELVLHAVADRESHGFTLTLALSIAERVPDFKSHSLADGIPHALRDPLLWIQFPSSAQHQRRGGFGR
ncbi:hypothetical protein HY256_09805, partial [Candidatus Sumerlaeota bacterium]|nr:hypothetical protein [Candidatus Sumerlaeota bacterium]